MFNLVVFNKSNGHRQSFGSYSYTVSWVTGRTSSL